MVSKVTYVHIHADSIQTTGDVVGKVTTVINRSLLSTKMKYTGVSVVAGLLLSTAVINSLRRREETIPITVYKNKKIIITIIILSAIIAAMGNRFYNNSLFRVKYRFSGTNTTTVSTGRLHRGGFRYNTQGKDFWVSKPVSGSKDFSILTVDNEVLYNTQTDSYFSVEVEREAYIGSHISLLKTARLRVEYSAQAMHGKEELIVLASTLFYLQDKLRVTNIVGGLNLIGLTVSIGALFKIWPKFIKPL